MGGNDFLAWIVPLGLALAWLPARATLQQDYIEGYLDLHQAELAGQNSDPANALKDYQASYGQLLKIRAQNPDWEKTLIESQIETCRTSIAALQGTPVPIPPTVNSAPQAPAPANVAPTLQQQYLEIYLKLNDAELMEKRGDFSSALNSFRIA